MLTSIIGFPRVGNLRELKFATEKYFKHQISQERLQTVAKEIREKQWRLLKENGIAAFTQEPSSSVAAYGVAGFGVYGVDIWAEADEAKKAVQIIEEIEKSLDTENAE